MARCSLRHFPEITDLALLQPAAPQLLGAVGAFRTHSEVADDITMPAAPVEDAAPAMCVLHGVTLYGQKGNAAHEVGLDDGLDVSLESLIRYRRRHYGGRMINSGKAISRDWLRHDRNEEGRVGLGRGCVTNRCRERTHIDGAPLGIPPESWALDWLQLERFLCAVGSADELGHDVSEVVGIADELERPPRHHPTPLGPWLRSRLRQSTVTAIRQTEH